MAAEEAKDKGIDVDDDGSADVALKADRVKGRLMDDFPIKFTALDDPVRPSLYKEFKRVYQASKTVSSKTDSGTPKYSGWKILALIFRAIKRMKVLLRQRQEQRRYCCLFNEYEFERETIIQLWMAVGFIIGQRYMEDLGNKDFEFLLEKQYLLFSRIDLLTGKNKYKVNPNKIIAYSNATSTMKNGLCAISDDESTKVDGSKSWHVSLVSAEYVDQTTIERLKGFNELKSLLFIRNYGSSLQQLPSSIFSTHTSIQALDLSGSHITELPSSTGNLRQLRYLDLSFTLIESLPETIDHLLQLQTLKLRGCKHLYELPKGMNKLISLRHLDFDVLGQLSFMPKGMGALVDLRTLLAYIVDSKDGYCNIRELKNMNNLSGSCCITGLENASFGDVSEAALHRKRYLTRLQLKWNDLKAYSFESSIYAILILHGIKLSSSLEELEIISFPGRELLGWHNITNFEKLVTVTLLKCENVYLNIIQISSLPNLKFLNIIHMNNATEIDYMFCGGHRNTFPSLEKFVIDGMENLKAWKYEGTSSFGVLSELIIKQCPKLGSLPVLSHLRSLKHLELINCTSFECLPEEPLSTSLETLIIDNCPILGKRCSKEGEDWHKVKHVPNVWVDQEDIHECHVRDDKENTDTFSGSDLDYSTDADELKHAL